jgi:putative addiction module CopG family antidote
MTMHVKLSAEMENYIKNKIASGFYKNSTEVIGDAIRRMKDQEEQMDPWKRAIAEGDPLKRPHRHEGTALYVNGAPGLIV